ncbi:MAG TPA: hypothetical protein VHY20_07790, partial [Pirellulales bacterium]|nr:hypothetical protein [Pirellulales bacterium]
MNFPGTTLGDAGLEQLPATMPLEAIQANGAPITDRGAQSLARFKRLRIINVINTSLTDEGVRTLSRLPLEKLNLNGTPISDLALKHLLACKTLTFLSLERTAVTDAGIALLPQFPALRDLQIRETRITALSAETLAGIKSLTLLSVSEPPMMPAEYGKLRAALPNCKIEVVPSKAPPVTAAAPKTVIPLSTANRQGLPDESQQQAAAKLVNDVYGEEIAQAKKPEDKAAAASKLLKKADEIRDEPAAAYVMLDLARGLAVDAGEAPLLVKINGVLGARFEVDPLQLLADDLEKSAQKPHPAAGFRAISDLALEHVDDALGADNFALAKRFSDTALAAGRKAKDPLVLKYALERGKSLTAARQQWDAAEAAKITLAQSPLDPEANLALGRFLCFVKGDWAAGFACLAKGSDDTLKELAAKSLADPQDAAPQAALGEAWADAADTAKGKSKTELQAGAKYWLVQAAPALTGLAKAKVEQRLKQIAPAAVSTAAVSTASSKPPRRSAANLNQQLARDRAAAEWVLGLRGKIGITVPNSSARKTVELASDLPEESFFLATVDLSSVKELTSDSLKNLEGLANLQELRLHRTPIGDAGVAHLK